MTKLTSPLHVPRFLRGDEGSQLAELLGQGQLAEHWPGGIECQLQLLEEV